ncbi:hypothetical protein BVY04_03515 [bacterium M21]|nr:hypothetical protein BVY04_03515 [bacterium M21]
MPLRTKTVHAPFLACGNRVSGMAMWTLATIAVLFGAYSWRYEPSFFLRFLAVLGIACCLEVAYVFLREGRFGWGSGSSMVTAAILLAGIPTNMPWLPLFFSLVVSIAIVKLPVGGNALVLNPALIGRLFLMLAFNAEVVDWTAKGVNPDALTTATPLDVYHSEETVHAVYGLGDMLMGAISGIWEELYLFVPNGPGEMFGLLILFLGLFLWWRGALDWRAGVAFLLSFSVTIGGLSIPVVREFVADVEGASFFPTLLRVVLFNVLGGFALFIGSTLGALLLRTAGLRRRAASLLLNTCFALLVSSACFTLLSCDLFLWATRTTMCTCSCHTQQCHQTHAQHEFHCSHVPSPCLCFGEIPTTLAKPYPNR